MDNIKRLFLEAWSLGEQNADNSYGGFGFWWDRNKSRIEHELKQTGTNTLVSGSVCECSEPIPQMTNKGMYCLRCETPIKQTDR